MSILADHIRQVAKTTVPLFIEEGKVVEVTNNECKVEVDEGIVLSGVKLRATINDTKEQILIRPRKGSQVLVALIGNQEEEACVVMYSEVDEVVIKIKDVSLQVDQNGFALAKDEITLKNTLQNLLQEVSKIVVVQGVSPDLSALKKIQNDLNTLFYQ